MKCQAIMKVYLITSVKQVSDLNETMREASEAGAEFVYMNSHLQMNYDFPLWVLMEGMVNRTAAAISAAFQSSEDRYFRGGALLRQVPYVYFRSLVIRVEAWNDVGSILNLLYMPDLEWSYRAVQKGWKLYVEPRVTSLYRQTYTTPDNTESKFLADKYGEDWLSLLWPTHPSLIEKGE